MRIKRIDWRAWYPEFAGYLAFGLALEWLLVVFGYLPEFSSPIMLMSILLALAFSVLRGVTQGRARQRDRL